MASTVLSDSIVCSGTNCLIRMNCERYARFREIRRRYAGREHKIPGVISFMSPKYEPSTYTCQKQVKIRNAK
ncbi:hypothetical protein EZ315_15580 (plasmid) [Duncaniella freteri]|uniref:Uncharacterized protein n=1 Tax=Duncaniella freteri TaxID=2530391 RepID=A0A4Z0UZE9_9BACT|nr:hypothetical protein EZ315_15580 [Duncaniella freteri]